MDGQREDVLLAARELSLDGFEAAFFTAGGELTNSLIQCIRVGWCAAYQTEYI